MNSIYPKTIQSSVEMMLEQRLKGLHKYPTALEDAQLSASELLRHAREEMADGSVYLAQLQEQFGHELIRNYERGMHDLLMVLKDHGHIVDLEGAECVLTTVLSGQYLPPFRCYAAPAELARFSNGNNLLTVCRERNPVFSTPIQVIP
jgi:hypothetical protein